jgi:hypothetical protein
MIRLSPSLPLPVIVPILVILFAWILFSEWKKPHRFRILRFLSTVVMVISLATILLRPEIRQQKLDGILLLTNKYDPNTADSILNAEEGMTAWQIADGPRIRNATVRRTFSDIAGKENRIRFVLGEGLPDYATDDWRQIGYRYFPSPLPYGIVDVNVPGRISANREHQLTLEFHSQTGSEWVVLRNPGGTEDSARLNHPGLQRITLTFTPRQPGEQTYSITVNDSTGNITDEPLPITVQQEEPLRILALASYPTFELQYLKRFLTSHNHNMVLRYQLSKGVFRYEYNNHKRVAADRLSRELLDQFDVLIADKTTIESLGRAAEGQVQEAIRAGMGLIVLGYPNEQISALFPFQGESVQRDTAVVQTSYKSLTLMTQPFRIVRTERIKPVVQNKTGLLAGISSVGRGKIGFQLLVDTYRLRLSGDSSTYSSIWTALIEKVARPLVERATIEVLSPFPTYENEPIDLQLISQQQRPNLVADSIEIPLREDAAIEDLWHGRVWLAEPGWHTLAVNGIAHPYFVAASGKWEALAAAKRIRFNTLCSQKSTLPTISAFEWREIPMIYPFLLFLAATGFLWLAPKL